MAFHNTTAERQIIKFLEKSGHTAEETRAWIEQIQLNSVGRCARVSYLTHDGVRAPAADIELALKLQSAGHMSPFEHVARPMTLMEEAKRQTSLGSYSGNF